MGVGRPRAVASGRFAVANLVLDQTEGYRFVVAPPAGRRWPPFKRWEAEVQEAGSAWNQSPTLPPPLVRNSWETVTRSRDVPLADVRSGAAWELNAALLTLHAVADEACANVASPKRHVSDIGFEADAQRLLEAQGSLSRILPVRLRILPKTNFSARGITIRSLSRYLGLCYEAVDVRWASVGPPLYDDRDYNVVLLPWPLTVRSGDFQPLSTTLIENMDRDLFDFFEFTPPGSLNWELVDSLLAAAGRVDAVILPESAVDAESIAPLESTLAANGVSDRGSWRTGTGAPTAHARSSWHGELQGCSCALASKTRPSGLPTVVAMRTCRGSPSPTFGSCGRENVRRPPSGRLTRVASAC